MPFWDAAITNKAVSFLQIIEVIFGMRMPPNAVQQLVNERYCPLLIEAFESGYGPLVESFFCDHVVAGVALTRRNFLLCNCGQRPPNSSAIAELLQKCDTLSTEAHYILGERDECTTVVALLFSIMHQGLNELDNCALGDCSPDKDRIALLTAAFEQTRDYYERAARRKALLEYLGGIAIGVGAVAILCAVLGVVFRAAGVSGLDPTPFVGSLLSGSIGATISVITRMSSGT